MSLRLMLALLALPLGSWASNRTTGSSDVVALQNARSRPSDGALMYQILCALLAAIGYGTAANCQPPQAGKTAITFQSSTYSDFRQILTREAATGTITVRASLGFPD